MDRKFKALFTPHLPPGAGPPAPGAAPTSQAERGAAPLSLGLDRRRRLGYGRAVGGAWLAGWGAKAGGWGTGLPCRVCGVRTVARATGRSSALCALCCHAVVVGPQDTKSLWYIPSGFWLHKGAWVLGNNGTRNRCKRSMLGRKCLTFCEKRPPMMEWACVLSHKSPAKAKICATTFAKV
jgi:hypothetical protein